MKEQSEPMQKFSKIYIARHCATRFNTENRLQGKRDIPLSKEGQQQAYQNIPVIANLGIERIISSQLKRAYETAEIYAKHLHIVLSQDERLGELDHGIWEAKTFEELSNNLTYTYQQWLTNPTSISIPESKENIIMAQKRILEAIKDIVYKYPNETILILTHKHIRATLFCALKGLSLREFQTQIDNSIEPMEILPDQIQRICGRY